MTFVNPSSSRRQHVLSAGVCGAVAALLTIQCGQTVSFIRALGNDLSMDGFKALAVTQSLLALTLALCAITRRVPPLAPLLAVAVVGTIAAGSAEWVRTAPASVLPAHIVPSNAFQCVQVVALACATRIRTVLWVVLACCPVQLALMSAGRGTLSLTRFDEWIMPSGATLAMAVIVTGLRRSARQADHASRQDTAMRLDATLAANATAAQEEARRLVHDHVISALRSVEVEHDPKTVRDSCRRALDAIAGLDPVGSAAHLAEAFAKVPDAAVTVAGRWAVVVPERVLHALRDAAQEAVRNAQRHSGTARVAIRLTTTPRGQAAIEVTDSGVGFDAAAYGENAGFGTSQSIAGRLSAVGGTAHVTSAPGAGTTVRLIWPALPEPVVGGIPSWGRAHRSRFYVTMLLPLVLVNLYLSLRHPGTSAGASLVLAVVVGTVTLANAWRFGQAPPTRLGLAALALFALTATWAGLVLAGDGALMSLESWIVGFCADLLAVIGLEVAVGTLAVLTVLQVGTVAAYAAHDPTITVFEPSGALLTPVALALLAATLGGTLRRGDRRLELDDAVRRARAEEAGWQTRLTEAQQRYLGRITGDIAGFLALLDAGGVVDEAVRQRAAVLAQRCRDDLLQAEPLPAELADAIAAARSAGVVVNLRQGAIDDPRLRELLVSVLASSAPRSVTAVTPSAVAPARLVVMPPLRSADLNAISRGVPSPDALSAEHDEVCTRLALVR